VRGVVIDKTVQKSKLNKPEDGKMKRIVVVAYANAATQSILHLPGAQNLDRPWSSTCLECRGHETVAC